jgi:urea transport system permease protein
MFFNNVRELPGFWKPFQYMPVTLLGVLILPTLAAALFGFFIVRKRVRGVYFSIITQALAWAAWLLISRNEMLMGGTNGLTNFYKPLNQDRHWIIGLYLTTLTVLVGGYLLCLAIVKSRLGRVLVAVRDKETRLYFAGYKPYAFKVFAFAVGAVLAAAGGMLYPVQTGIITPQNMNVEASIFIVLGVALGGRGRLWGAIYGELLVFILASALSSDLQDGWLLVEGLLFVGVVLFLPDGFVGIWQDLERKITRGVGMSRYVATATPLVLTAIFALVETLGLMPAFLRKTVPVPGMPPLQLKYIFLIVILAAVAWWNQMLTRAEKKAVLQRAAAVEASEPAIAQAATAASSGGGHIA